MKRLNEAEQYKRLPQMLSERKIYVTSFGNIKIFLAL